MKMLKTDMFLGIGAFRNNIHCAIMDEVHKLVFWITTGNRSALFQSKIMGHVIKIKGAGLTILSDNMVLLKSYIPSERA